MAEQLVLEEEEEKRKQVEVMSKKAKKKKKSKPPPASPPAPPPAPAPSPAPPPAPAPEPAPPVVEASGEKQLEAPAREGVGASECPICMEKSSSCAALVPCGHVFNLACADKFVGAKCPICKVDASSRLRIYFS